MLKWLLGLAFTLESWVRVPEQRRRLTLSGQKSRQTQQRGWNASLKQRMW